MDDFCIRRGYRPNPAPLYHSDTPGHLVHQPHVYELAGYLGERCGAAYLIDVGCGNGGKLLPLASRFRIIGIDVGENAERAARQGIDVRAHDLEQGLPAIAPEVLARSIVVCADVAEHLVDPTALLRELGQWSHRCPYLLLSTPDRVRARGPGDMGPPANPAHVREWAMDEFDAVLTRSGFDERLLGHTINTQHHHAKTTLLAVAGREVAWQPTPGMRSLAIVNVFNEEDIIGEALAHLLRQGLDVLVIDNWSSDGTAARIATLADGDPRVRVERFPAAPSSHYEWHRLLENVAERAASSGYDWVFHTDADELRYSPWPGRSLSQAVAFVDYLGYNAIDFTVVDFRYTDDCDAVTAGFEDDLRWFEFGHRPGHFLQVKAWRQRAGERCELAASGGHEARFPDRRVFPLKFLVKHYPLRSRAQAATKIRRDRLPRVALERAKRGWHTQYDQYAQGPLPSWRRSDLTAWSDHLFATEFLVERLSGIGIERLGER